AKSTATMCDNKQVTIEAPIVGARDRPRESHEASHCAGYGRVFGGWCGAGRREATRERRAEMEAVRNIRADGAGGRQWPAAHHEAAFRYAGRYPSEPGSRG